MKLAGVKGSHGWPWTIFRVAKHTFVCLFMIFLIVGPIFLLLLYFLVFFTIVAFISLNL